MTVENASSSRRRFIRIGVAGLAAAPFAGAFVSRNAMAADALAESDPTAKALNYTTDAGKATARTDKTATCSNCNFFTGKAGAADGPCSVFGGKLVSAKGWCSAWAKKG
jgi:hypothetical protein